LKAIGRAVRHAAELNLFARHETFQHLQRQIMGAEEERYADLPISELLRGLHRRITAHHQRRKRHDGAPANLATANLAGLDTAVIAPFAGVVEVGLALFEQPAMTSVAIESFPGDVSNIELRALVDTFFTVGPSDREPFFFE